MAGTELPTPENLPIISDEIAVLLRLAEEHPVKALKIEKLVEGWIGLQEAIRARLN